MSNTIKIVGDVHGKTGDYKRIVRDMPARQRSIQIGDMGVGFSGVVVHDMSQDHKWFRGNHDNPEKCRKHPNYLGDYGYFPEDSLFWMAGAYSIDKMYRQIGVSWWPDEELIYSDMDKAIKLYKEVKPDYVLSHDAPASIGRMLLADLIGPSALSVDNDGTRSKTSEALQEMFDSHQPKEWVFGHWHVNKTINFKATKFTCVPELGVYDLDIYAKNDE